MARDGPTMGGPDALLCRVHASLWALPLEHVIEVMRPLPLETVGGAPPFVAGLSRIRGAAAPVVDLARLVAGEESKAATRFVTVRSGRQVVALRVDAVVGFASLSGAIADLPPLFRDDDGPIAALGERDRALLLVLRTARLLPPDFPASFGGASA